MLSVVIRIVIYADCYYAECRSAECHGASTGAQSSNDLSISGEVK